jgi:hypothetical protein
MALAALVATIAPGAQAMPLLPAHGCAPTFGSGTDPGAFAFWLGKWPTAANSDCPGPPPAFITYTKTTTDQAFWEYGLVQPPFSAAGPTLDPAMDPALPAGDFDAFVGTAVAPDAGQNGNGAFASGAASNPNVQTIAVAQQPVTVLLSLPALAGAAACMITTPTAGIPNTVLSALFDGAFPTWAAFLGAAGIANNGSPSCGTPITLMTRSDPDPPPAPPSAPSIEGSTNALKQYLAQINYAVWAKYKTSYNLWPAPVVSATACGPGATNWNGDVEAQSVAFTPGSVGYGAVSAAASPLNGGFTSTPAVSTFGAGACGGPSIAHQILWAQLQNNGFGAPTYADPQAPAPPPLHANCQTAALVPGDKGFSQQYKDSWYDVLPSDPNVAGDAGAPAAYPLCQMVYALGYHHYNTPTLAGFFGAAGGAGNPQGSTAKDFLWYVVHDGQADIATTPFWAPIPTGMVGVDQVDVGATFKGGLDDPPLRHHARVPSRMRGRTRHS